jgi:hypothetical protein
MGVTFNTMVKNESIMLDNILPIWKKYPIDYFIFYDDNSTDETCEIIKKHLDKDRFIILNDKLPKFNEGYQRQKMIDESRNQKFDFVFSIDADELLSSSIVNNFDSFLKNYESIDLLLFWYNCINDSINYYRNDPLYSNNFRSFVLPLSKTSNLNINNWRYHTPRTPNVNLPKQTTKDFGVLHLQSCNLKYYVLKQLWYKHYEFVHYGLSANEINQKYDPVINNLNFHPRPMIKNIIEGIDINLTFFDDLQEIKGYKKFIEENYNEDLITFGKTFL